MDAVIVSSDIEELNTVPLKFDNVITYIVMDKLGSFDSSTYYAQSDKEYWDEIKRLLN